MEKLMAPRIRGRFSLNPKKKSRKKQFQAGDIIDGKNGKIEVPAEQRLGESVGEELVMGVGGMDGI